ncbi:MAG: hypothetical protein AAGH19_03025 [Pseudomonadota bacterium]
MRQPFNPTDEASTVALSQSPQGSVGTALAVALILLLALFLIYGAALHTVYLFADETWLFDEEARQRGLAHAMFEYTRGFGRPLTAPIHFAFSHAILFGEEGMLALRWVQFLCSFAMAFVFYGLLRRLGLQTLTALLLTVFIWSQPGFAIRHFYAHTATSWAPALASLLAFWLVLDERSPLRAPASLLLAFGLFLAGFFTTQVAPFYCAGLIALATLQDKSLAHWPACRNLFLALMAAFGAYLVFYFVARYGLGWFTYRGGTRFALTPEALSVFEFWNYPIRSSLSRGQVQLLCALVGGLWLLTLLAAFMGEKEPLEVRLKRWGLALACVGSTFIVVVADGASGRQHLFLAAIPAVVLTGWFALHSLMSTNRWLKAAGLVLVVVVMIGAARSFPRDLVQPAAKMLSYIQTSVTVTDTPPETPLTVLMPPKDTWEGICVGQPCGGFYARQFQLPFHLAWSHYYTSAMRLSGVPWQRPIVFEQATPERPLDAAAYVIDWPAYLEQETCLGNLTPLGYLCKER